jgi:hypothetical protein
VLASRLLAVATVSRQLIRMPRRKRIAPSLSACTYALFGNGDDENEICALQEHLTLCATDKYDLRRRQLLPVARLEALQS